MMRDGSFATMGSSQNGRGTSPREEVTRPLQNAPAERAPGEDRDRRTDKGCFDNSRAWGSTRPRVAVDGAAALRSAAAGPQGPARAVRVRRAVQAGARAARGSTRVDRRVARGARVLCGGRAPEDVLAADRFPAQEHRAGKLTRSVHGPRASMSMAT